MSFLNYDFVKKYWEIINSTNIFYEDDRLKPKWNFICTFIDRIDSAVKWLNNHDEKLETENDLIMFLVHASIIKDGINKSFESLLGEELNIKNEKKWFSNAVTYGKKYFNVENCPTDDAFFEYLRSLAFAHPFDTKERYNARPFLQRGEINTSPWVINQQIIFNKGYYVGVRIYSNLSENILDLHIDFESLKSYIAERFNLIAYIIKWLEKEINNENKKWKLDKIDRSKEIEDILMDCINISKKRFIYAYCLEDAYKIMKYNSDIDINVKSVNKIKKIIKNKMNDICEYMDDLKYDDLFECLDFLYTTPKNLYMNAGYDLQKIFCDLASYHNISKEDRENNFCFCRVKMFYENYARKYVEIDFDNMSIEEIVLLIRISCIIGFVEERNFS